MAYTVGEVARRARVSVRTLHHYDAVGLVRPSGRSRAGYRLYTDRDVERLHQVLVFRELGFALEHIVRILTDPDFDRRAALIQQRALLAERAARTHALVASIDRQLDALQRGRPMTPDELFEAFGAFDPAAHEAEAEARWGQTEAFAESRRRTARYTPADWKTQREEADAITDAVATALEAGEPATSPRAMDAAERHRAHLERWFYPCPYAMHAALGAMYASDARFAAHYARRHPQLAAYLRDAIVANAARHGVASVRDPE